MPFLTEELWLQLWGDNPPNPTLALAAWPIFNSDMLEAIGQNSGAVATTQLLQELIARLRSLRAELRIPASARPRLRLLSESLAAQDREFILLGIRNLAGTGEIEWVASASALGQKRLGRIHGAGYDAQWEIESLVDLSAERQRLEKEREHLARGVLNLERQLANPDFLQNARPDVVEQARAQLADRRQHLERVDASLSALAAE